MTSEPVSFTWQTLYEYIEGLITGVINIQQSLRDHPHSKLSEIYTTTFERELMMWRSSLLLISEMQKKENLHNICPIMGLDTIRLYCRHWDASFAWITPIANGQYRLVRMGRNESQAFGKLDSVDMNLIQIVDEVEKLVNEICVDKNK